MSLLRAAVKKSVAVGDGAERRVNDVEPPASHAEDSTDFHISPIGNMGIIDAATIEADLEEQSQTTKRSKYKNWTDEDRWKIGKLASELGTSAALRHYKKTYPGISESTIRGFKNRYQEKLKRGDTSEKSLPKYQTRTGRPLLIGGLDGDVRKYLTRVADRGGIITRAVAVSVAKSLLKRNPSYGEIVINETWAQSLLRRMNFVRRQKTTDKVHIPDGARKEIEYQFYHQIASLIERHNISDELVINFDQTPCKMVPVGRVTMAEKNAKRVLIYGSTDKRSITGTFAVTLAGDFLPMQLIYGGKTTQSLPKYKFPSSFSLSVNPTHYSNSEECIKYLKEIIVPYVVRTRRELGLPEDQKALLIYDVFTGQTTLDFNDYVEKSDLVATHVPNNMTADYQTLDATVNKYCKTHSRKKFNDWYCNQVTEQLDAGVELETVEVKLRLTTLKPIHAGWLVDLYNHMTTPEGKKIILAGWRATGILDAVNLGVSKLPSLDPFADIDPPMVDTVLSAAANLEAVSSMSEAEKVVGYAKSSVNDDDSDEDEWEREGSKRSSSTIIDDESDDDDE